jgi:ketosteroid isomerase-like protein
MSQENVEIVRRFYEAAARHDVEAVVSGYTDHAEWHMPPDWPEDRAYRGKEAIAGFMTSWFETFGEHCFLLDQFEYREVGERVLVLGRQQVSATGGGPAVAEEFGQVLAFEGPLINRSDMYATHRGALEAVGLSE